jgi:hypothetical protein
MIEPVLAVVVSDDVSNSLIFADHPHEDDS